MPRTRQLRTLDEREPPSSQSYMYSGSAEPTATAADSERNPDAMWLLALCAAAPEPYPIAQPAGHEGASVAFRNNCTTNCALLIMLHGLGGDGQKMAAGSQLHEKFVGIVAYPSSVPFATGWPVVEKRYVRIRAVYLFAR